jgi:hypothetical protein
MLSNDQGNPNLKCYDRFMDEKHHLKSYKKTKLLHHEHTGKLRPHHHTSYGSLLLIVVVASFFTLACRHEIANADNIGTYGVVQSSVPTVAPQITNLVNNRTVTTNNSIIVSGSCQDNTQVEVFKNNVMAGSIECKNLAFSLNIDLFYGNNNIVAEGYSQDNIAGPVSSSFSIKFVPPSVVASGATTSPESDEQFYMTTQADYKGASVGKKLNWTLTLHGGESPYNVTVSWGDGKTDALTVNKSGQFVISHVYNASTNKNFGIIVEATDSYNSEALLQLSAIVQGAPTTLGSTNGGSSGPNLTIFKAAGLAFGILAFIIFAFWLGEKRELKLVNHHAN